MASVKIPNYNGNRHVIVEDPDNEGHVLVHTVNGDGAYLTREGVIALIAALHATLNK